MLTTSVSSEKKPVIINQSEFKVGSGNPKWDEISTIKIAYETNDSKDAGIHIGEISTYGAKSPCASIWFDDGWKSTYTDAYPIMKEKGFHGILSVISSHVNFQKYCSTGQLDEMYANGWDYVNHTHSHKNLSELNAEEAEKEITACDEYLKSHGYDRACENIVPPYCETDETVDNLIRKYANSSRPKWDSFNYLPVTDPYNLGFREVTAETPPETACAWIDDAIANDMWIILLFHSIESTADVSSKYTPDNFKKSLIICTRKNRKLMSSRCHR